MPEGAAPATLERAQSKCTSKIINAKTHVNEEHSVTHPCLWPAGHGEDWLIRHGYFQNDIHVLTHIGKVLDADTTLWDKALPPKQLKCGTCSRDVYIDKVKKLFIC